MHSFTPVASLLGGVLIGVATALLLLGAGHLAAISGITARALGPTREGRGWRVLFLAGLLCGGAGACLARPEWFAVTLTRSAPALVVARLLVGFGTRLGNGCTSGHGICGISRWSTRSIVATCTFITTGIVTVTVINRVWGGVL